MSKSGLFYPAYFPAISQYAAMTQVDELWLEVDDNFQKQTLRNRLYIYSPNGKQLLIVPIQHSKIAHQKTRDIKIDNSENWQKQHWKSLEAAYRSSPYFEFFEDDLNPIYSKRQVFLKDLNEQAMAFVKAALGWSYDEQKTQEFFKMAKQDDDFRHLVTKSDKSQLQPYYQTFQEKNGFINNLSILDLIFNEGRQALNYLKSQEKISSFLQ